MLEAGIVLHISRNRRERILLGTLLAAGLVQLVVAQLVHFHRWVVINSIEGSIRLYHGFLLVLWEIGKTALDFRGRLDAHLLGTCLSES